MKIKNRCKKYLNLIELQCNVLFLSGFGVELDIKNERKRVCRGQGQDMGVLMWVGGAGARAGRCPCGWGSPSEQFLTGSCMVTT